MAYLKDMAYIINKMSIEKVIKLADMRMFRNKKIFKEKNAIQNGNHERLEEHNTCLRASVVYNDVDPKLVEE